MPDPASNEHHAPVHGITIWLDSYDDIFSDFDSREYDHRALSDDFLAEMRKLIREKNDAIEDFHLLLPSGMRDAETEKVISKRLHDYFHQSYERLSEEMRALRRKAILFSAVGLFFLLTAGYISFLKPEMALLHLLMTTCEPAGWFFVWMGYDVFANVITRKKPERDFCDTMSASTISFKAL